MALDSIERLLVRIIIGCAVLITYLLGLRYYPSSTDLGTKDSNHSIINSDQIHDHAGSRQATLITNEWIYHRTKVHFVHPAITLQTVTYQNIHGSIPASELERSGLFASEHIPFGSILSVEDPVFSSSSFVAKPDDFWASYIDRVVKEHFKKDPEFKRFWKSLPVHQLQKKRMIKMLKSINKLDYKSAVNNYVRFATNKISSHRRPWALYSVIGRLGFNFPQNAMVVIGKNDKALLISTKAIEKGEEIVTDHFGDWLNPQLLETDNLNARKVRAGDRGFDLNQKWIKFLKELRDDSLPTEEKNEMFLEMYPNGMLGKDATQKLRVVDGCKRMELRDCVKKSALMKMIGSGSVFGKFDAARFNANVGEMDSDKCLDDAEFCGEMKQ